MYLWNVDNRIFVFEGIGGCILLCQTQTTIKHELNDIIFSYYLVWVLFLFSLHHFTFVFTDYWLIMI